MANHRWASRLATGAAVAASGPTFNAVASLLEAGFRLHHVLNSMKPLILTLTLLLALKACRVACAPAAYRLYGEEVQITQKADNEDQFVIRIPVEVFQTAVGPMIYDLRDKQASEEEVLVYDGYMPPAKIQVMMAQAALDQYDEQYEEVSDAMQDELDKLDDRFQVVNATLFADVSGDLIRRDMRVINISYDALSRELEATVEWEGDRRVLDLTGAAEAAALNTWNSSLLECGAGEDEDGMRYNCGALAGTLDEYGAVLELRPKFVRARPKSGKEKLEECSDRMVELACTGKSCVRVLPAIGVDFGWRMGTTSYQGIVTGAQCCELKDICETHEAANDGSCAIKDDGQGGREALGMTVGDIKRNPGGEQFQAQCQPDCGMGKWGQCRWGRTRCKHNCRCSWWC